MFRIGVYHEPALAAQATVVRDALRGRSSEMVVEIVDVHSGAGEAALNESVTVLIHDKSTPGNAMATWIAARLQNAESKAPLIPLSCGPLRVPPPAGLARLKGAHWPDDSAVVLDRIGVFLGLLLLPGAQKVFISYKTSDGEAAAVALEMHLQSLGYRVFRDASRDHADGSPNIKPGEDLRDVLVKHVHSASVVVLLDTPEAPKSEWIHGETKLAIGRRIPILPVVFRMPGDEAEGSRFRRLKELHRFVGLAISPGASPVLGSADLDHIVRDIEAFLLAIAQRRRACIDGLMREFAGRDWSFEGYRDFSHLFEAQRRRSRAGQRAARFFSCCSLEDDVRAASVISFVREIKDATTSKNYAKHIYFHLGDPLFGEDLDYMQREAIPAVEDRNIDFCHYQEAPLKLGLWLAAH